MKLLSYTIMPQNIDAKIFRQIKGICEVFLSCSLLILFYESKWSKSIKNTYYRVARKFDIFRFIEALIKINHANEFENYYNEMYPAELILAKENTSNALTTFLDFHLYIIKCQIQTSFTKKETPTISTL